MVCEILVSPRLDNDFLVLPHHAGIWLRRCVIGLPLD